MLTPGQWYDNILKIVEIKGRDLGVTEEQGTRVGTEWVIKLGEPYTELVKRVQKGAAPVWTDYTRTALGSMEAALGFNNPNIVTQLDTPTAKLLGALQDYADEPDTPPVIAKRWSEESVSERALEVFQRHVAELVKREGISEAEANDRFIRTPLGQGLYDIYADTSPAASWDAARYLAHTFAANDFSKWAVVKKHLAGDIA